MRSRPPNKRLKLTGGDRSKGSGVFEGWIQERFPMPRELK